jgi:hypothetical protein
MEGTVTEGWSRRLTERSALGERVQVPGEGVWRAGLRSKNGGSRQLPGPYIKGPRIPLRSFPLFRLYAFRPFFPLTDDPLLPMLYLPVALSTGEAGRISGSARGLGVG